MSAAQEDLKRILRALDLFDGARSESPPDVVMNDVLPEIERMRARIIELEGELYPFAKTLPLESL